jgi:hypothetical protein
VTETKEESENEVPLKQAKLTYKDGSEFSGFINSKTKQRQGYGTMKRKKIGGLVDKKLIDFEYTG